MIGRIVEIAEDGRHLAKSRGFLTVSGDGAEIGRIPLDDVTAVIASAHGITYSNNLLVALAERCAPVVFCAANHRPAAFLWSVEGHHEQAGRMADQAGAGKPLKKRLWAQLVAAKIESQSATLEAVKAPHQGFHLLSRKVRSGDPDNVEAQAARRYWPLLFGKKFRRDRSSDGVNAMLNYTYTVLRAGTARAIMSAGLHPSFGLAHRQRGNAFALADDLMEPFRPLADLLIHDLVNNGANEVNKETKAGLARILVTDMSTTQGVSPVGLCLQRAAQSLVNCFAGDARSLDLPRRILPLEA
ncbi:type II CRISPR-associated endonuclease Cas1 [Hyphobacterium sp. HN65]|uniref:CRISPR-associated endonuclease Cas1 n=1 Tax=Hyphobacterium lacteum TaxID=3116575 RepID=A0ABU7LSB4_9PROT|nr:type II CRISPR-associated endonuclease Cas1 [Hyphobacterium sp. HN65]MEE2526229.1 type II CRISPR-associated endonuclease Cas1 [Hyphobacterium sp. HN65]